MKNSKLTIITPTYNRASLLPNLYYSLCEQSCQNFQWLIIDDGSNDNTYSVINDFISENKICIKYVYKRNGGKHTALNYSHSYIDGDYVVIVDSDDYLIDDAVKIILDKWKMYSNNFKIAGITFQKGKKQNLEAFDPFIKGEYISTFVNETNKGMRGDHCETVRTSVFINFLFPEYDDECFVPEGAMWYLITKDYNVVYSDKIIYIAEYLEGGLTKSGRSLHLKNPKGCMWHASVFIDNKFNWKIKIKKILLYICYAKILGITKHQIINELQQSEFLIALLWPFGCVLSKIWGIKYEQKG